MANNSRPLAAKITTVQAAMLLVSSATRGQTVIESFPGVDFTTVSRLGTAGTPPDTMGAAGTNQFVEFINGAFAVYDKAGNLQSLITDKAFWLNAGISAATMAAGLSDTRIMYDAGSGRWFATEITVNDTGNQVLLARSDSSNPSGPWKAVSFLGNSGFADYDTLGVDSQGVYVGVNDFSSSSGDFIGVSFFSIPKADLLAATPTASRMTRFDDLSDRYYGWTLQGVCDPDSGPGHGVMVAIDNVGFNFFDRTTINGSGAAGATLSPTVRIPIAYDSSPNPATQPGGDTVDALDDRFSSAVKQIGGYIFMANTFTEGSKDAVHWIVLNETNNTVAGEGIISDPSYDFFQPSIAASHNGKILMGFNRCGTVALAGDISIYAAVGFITNGAVTMGAPFLLKQGKVADFTISFDSAPYRWGDFSATILDPTDDNLLWTIQEIPASPTSWGTQISLISVATNLPSLAITPAQYAFGGYFTNTTPGPRFGQVTAVSNLVSVLLNWPLSADPAYVLQSSTNLLDPAAWTAVTNVPVVSINQNIVTMPVSNSPAFYFRLMK